MSSSRSRSTPPARPRRKRAELALPDGVARTLARFGVPPDTRAGIGELYRFLGPGVIDAVAGLPDSLGIPPGELTPEHLAGVRMHLGEAFLRDNHPRWLQELPTPAFWRDRSVEGGATGLAIPLGDLAAPTTEVARKTAGALRIAAGPNQPPPRGLLVASRNSHYGNRPGVFSVDLVPSSLDDALAFNGSVGQQHTLPGSLGEASGTSGERYALLWEVQPNVYRPNADRNPAARAPFRRHRNWHLAVSIGAFAWLFENRLEVFALRGRSLAATHEVNAAKPVTPEIESMHDRTVEAAAAALGRRLVDVADVPEDLLRLCNAGLTREAGRQGLAALVRQVL